MQQTATPCNTLQHTATHTTATSRGRAEFRVATSERTRGEGGGKSGARKTGGSAGVGARERFCAGVNTCIDVNIHIGVNI